MLIFMNLIIKYGQKIYLLMLVYLLSELKGEDMTVTAISNENNKQNNIYAAAGAVAAGTAGGVAGRFIAPKAAKSLDDMLTVSPDVFEKTMNNMKAKDGAVFAEAMQTVFPARSTLDNFSVIINQAFNEDAVPVDKLKDFIKQKEDLITLKVQKFDEVVNKYIANKDQMFTLNEFHDDLLKNNALTEQEFKLARLTVANAVGEEVLSTPLSLDDALLQTFNNSKKQLASVSNSEINIYKALLKLEKDGIVAKKDMLESVKVEAKTITDSFLQNTSFDKIKKFVPKKGVMKWASIIGAASAVIVGGAIKLFGGKIEK